MPPAQRVPFCCLEFASQKAPRVSVKLWNFSSQAWTQASQASPTFNHKSTASPGDRYFNRNTIHQQCASSSSARCLIAGVSACVPAHGGVSRLVGSGHLARHRVGPTLCKVHTARRRVALILEAATQCHRLSQIQDIGKTASAKPQVIALAHFLSGLANQVRTS